MWFFSSKNEHYLNLNTYKGHINIVGFKIQFAENLQFVVHTLRYYKGNVDKNNCCKRGGNECRTVRLVVTRLDGITDI